MKIMMGTECGEADYQSVISMGQYVTECGEADNQIVISMSKRGAGR